MLCTVFLVQLYHYNIVIDLFIAHFLFRVKSLTLSNLNRICGVLFLATVIIRNL